MSNVTVIKLALLIDRTLQTRYQEYLEVCEQDAKEGHRPHHCEHGTNQWTDYDNICGPCEDGWTISNPLSRRRMALMQAHDRWDEFQAILAAMQDRNLRDLLDPEATTRRLTTLLAV